jgi:uncharacterized membrane protein YphA (DoxX/SURF4 family)
MAQRVLYWGSTVLLAVGAALAGFSYLSGAAEAVNGFAHVGYPQHLRIMLGIAKISGGLALIAPGFPKLKEWAYAGFTFTWIAAAVAHYMAKDGAVSAVPLVFLVLLAVSYMTRPENRRWPALARA